MISYEVFEKSGSVHFVVLNDCEFQVIVTNVEEMCMQPDGYGWINFMIDDLGENPMCWKNWIVYDGDDAKDIYDDLCTNGKIVAWGVPENRKIVDGMGYNSMFLLGYIDGYNGEGYKSEEV